MAFAGRGKGAAISRTKWWEGIQRPEVRTVIKETDDDSPNTVTTTIKNKPEKNSVNPHEGFMSPTQRRMIDMLDQSVAELGAGDTREMGPLVEQGRKEYEGDDTLGHPTLDPTWTNPAPTGTQNQPKTYPTGNPWDQHGTMTENGVSPPDYGAQRQQMMSDIDAMMAANGSGQFTGYPNQIGITPPGFSGRNNPPASAGIDPAGQATPPFELYPNQIGITPPAGQTFAPRGQGERKGNPDDEDEPTNTGKKPRGRAPDRSGNWFGVDGDTDPYKTTPGSLTYGPDSPQQEGPPGTGTTGEKWSPAAGSKTTAKAVIAATEKANDDPTSNTINGSSPNLEQRDELVRSWGSLAYDPEKRRKEYLDRMNKIFRNTALLEALSIMTGNQSRAAGYNKMMMGMLDNEIKFDSEDRLYELSRSLYYDTEGNFDPPKTKAEAFHALVKMGASIDEATAITQHVPEAVAQDLVEWSRVNPQTGLIETVQVPGKKGRPQGTGWNKKYEVTKDQWDDENPDISTPTTTESERNRVFEQMLLNELRTAQPGTDRYDAAMTQLRSLKGSDPQKLFSELYLDDSARGKWQTIKILDGVDEDGKPKYRQPLSIEEAMGWWSDPNNDSVNSYNYTMGWTPAQIGVTASAATEIKGEFETQLDAAMAAKEGKIKPGDRISIGGVTGTWEVET